MASVLSRWLLLMLGTRPDDSGSDGCPDGAADSDGARELGTRDEGAREIALPC
jgi:hypothetical protein